MYLIKHFSSVLVPLFSADKILNYACQWTLHRVPVQKENGHVYEWSVQPHFISDFGLSEKIRVV